MKHTVGYISIFFPDGNSYLHICFFKCSQIAEKAKFIKNGRLVPIRKADDLNESVFFLLGSKLDKLQLQYPAL